MQPKASLVVDHHIWHELCSEGLLMTARIEGGIWLFIGERRLLLASVFSFCTSCEKILESCWKSVYLQECSRAIEIFCRSCQGRRVRGRHAICRHSRGPFSLGLFIIRAFHFISHTSCTFLGGSAALSLLFEAAAQSAAAAGRAGVARWRGAARGNRPSWPGE